MAEAQKGIQATLFDYFQDAKRTAAGRGLSFIPSNSIDALITVIYTSLAGCFLGSLRC